jgi:hypothetical protein
VPPERSDRIDSVKVWEAEDMEEFGASRRREGLEAGSKSALEFVGSHLPEATPSNRRPLLGVPVRLIRQRWRVAPNPVRRTR